MVRYLLPIFVLLLDARPAEGQEERRLTVSDKLWEVHLAAGESYVGRIMGVSEYLFIPPLPGVKSLAGGSPEASPPRGRRPGASAPPPPASRGP